MTEFIKSLSAAPLANVLILGGMVFLLLGLIGKVTGKIDPGRASRTLSASVGTVLIAVGLIMYAHPQAGPITNTTTVTTPLDTTHKPDPVVTPPDSHVDPPPPPPPPRSITVNVPANGWTDTKLVVQTGQELIIDAKGEWNVRPKFWPRTGPSGYPNEKELASHLPNLSYEEIHQRLPLASAPSGALIGKVGGHVFLVGPHLAKRMRDPGKVFLGCNDIDENNVGSMTADITLRTP